MDSVKMYSIFDKIAEKFAAPFIAVNDGVAWRNFENALKQCPEEHREDYELYCVGLWDEDKGLVQEYKLTCVGSGSQISKESK